MKTLYNITIKTYGSAGFYVVADDPTSAYEKVRKLLDERKVYYRQDRELDTIKVIAVGEYSSSVPVLIE
jgi:hypothetical protein